VSAQTSGRRANAWHVLSSFQLMTAAVVEEDMVGMKDSEGWHEESTMLTTLSCWVDDLHGELGWHSRAGSVTWSGNADHVTL
jgi:hypothetical protein